jgi:hypothetical protein
VPRVLRGGESWLFTAVRRADWFVIKPPYEREAGHLPGSYGGAKLVPDPTGLDLGSGLRWTEPVAAIGVSGMGAHAALPSAR